MNIRNITQQTLGPCHHKLNQYHSMVFEISPNITPQYQIYLNKMTKSKLHLGIEQYSYCYFILPCSCQSGHIALCCYPNVNGAIRNLSLKPPLPPFYCNSIISEKIFGLEFGFSFTFFTYLQDELRGYTKLHI